MTNVSGVISNSQRLRHKIDLASPELASAANALHSHPLLAQIVPEYLFTMHCVIRAAVPLMTAALERSRGLAADDPVASGLVSYFPKHIREETNHDEWLLSDLAVLGFERSEILKRIPPATVAKMVGAQYYWIFHYHPVALLGYIEVLEGYPPTVEQVDQLVAKTGYPREAFSTTLKHAYLDPHHRDELNMLLDELPLTPAQSALVGVSALQTVHVGAQAIREAIERGEAAVLS